MLKVSNHRIGLVVGLVVILAISFLSMSLEVFGAVAPELELRARPMNFAIPNANPYAMSGYTPTQIRTAYNLPSTGGTGTIAIIDAYDDLTIVSDLTYFSAYFSLPLPNSANYEEHHMSQIMSFDGGWALETALDVEWAHAIAPAAKILLVQAKSNRLVDLFAAIDYARARPDVVAISMSWGTNEFASQTSYNYHFASSYGAVFFASSGDDGAGVIWPSSSTNVISVGGTTLNLDANGYVVSETSWSGSGGGISQFEPKPSYQADYGVSAGTRAVPDVSYNANPSTGFPVYNSGAWIRVGGTSAGAPQWAAIQALGGSASNYNFYQVAKSSANTSYFRDITTGSNGGYNAGPGYDYVTGLGCPVTINFAHAQAIAGTQRFDLGPFTSPVEPGYTQVTETTAYSISAGYGWNITAGLASRDRLAPNNNLTRDFVFNSINSTFNVDLTNGNYSVTLRIGDNNFNHDLINIYAEDILKISNLTVPAGTFSTQTFNIALTDGQLNLRFYDAGGTDLNWVINAITIQGL